MPSSRGTLAHARPATSPPALWFMRRRERKVALYASLARSLAATSKRLRRIFAGHRGVVHAAGGAGGSLGGGAGSPGRGLSGGFSAAAPASSCSSASSISSASEP